MPNPNRYDILPISIFSRMAISISISILIFSKMVISILIFSKSVDISTIDMAYRYIEHPYSPARALGTGPTPWSRWATLIGWTGSPVASLGRETVL